MSVEGFKSQLDGILEEYDSIAKAPTLRDLELKAQRTKMDIDDVLKAEALRDYKAIDNDTGRIYLIKNPVTWPATERGVRRPTPVFQMTLNEARSGLTISPGRGKKKANVSECF